MPSITINLNRNTLAKFLPNPESIRAFESLFDTVNFTLPSSIEEVQSLAEQAQAGTTLALALLSQAQEIIDMLSSAPAIPPAVDADDSAPSVYLGTLSTQNHDSVSIIGGTINLDAGTVAAPSLTFGGDYATGVYRIGANNLGLSINGNKLGDFSATAAAFLQNLSTTGQLISTVATGTAPLSVASTTNVPNLNASSLNGATFAAPGAIGFTTPAAAQFTSIATTTGGANIGNGTTAVSINANGNTTVGSAISVLNNGTRIVAIANKSGILGGAYDATAYIWSSGTLQTSAGLQVTGTFGCNGKPVQASVALGAAATDLPTVITLANNIRSALINNGIGS